MNGAQLIVWLHSYSILRDSWDMLKRDSWLFLGFCALYMILLHPLNMWSNPLLWRVILLTDNPYNPLHLKIGANGNHELILIAIFITTLLLYRKIKLYPVCLAGVAYVLFTHELAWWFTDFFFDPRIDLAIGQTLWALSMVFMMFYPKIFGFHWKYLVAMGSYYVFWGAFFQFHVSYNFSTGFTSYYLDPFVNLLEILSWVWALFWFWYLERENLKKRVEAIQNYLKLSEQAINTTS